MDTEIDWQRELDSSFGDGRHVPAGHYVAAGRRAVRRRRATAVATGLGAAAVVAGIAWGAAPGGTPSGTEAPVATDPIATSTPTAETSTPEPGGSGRPWGAGGPPVRHTREGIEIRDGAVVHERRDDLYPGKGTDSVALDISFGDERWWTSLEWDGDGGGMTAVPADDKPFDSFDAFVRAEVLRGGLTDGPALDDERYPYAGLVGWTGGEVSLAPGVTVDQQVLDPSGERESIGLVLRHRGEVTWMLLDTSPTGGSAVHEKESESGWLTFEQWLDEHVAIRDREPRLRLVDLEQDGTVSAALPDVQVLDQQSGPDLPDYGTDAASASAVALVEWEEERWFVLAVRMPDEDALTTYAADKAGVETIDDFIAFTADQADEGGLR
ncbi:hypothetical protein CFI00_21180 [Nocardioides sp. S5]|uniref:hypothetical protein n=1 Tax=Nocardioides sp. S5 TaxID=2017486 RepID=UPI001A8DA2E8|nr:hypothetical protein [Nocardioides sp. S5]QSR32967.1 hypothetical protein CFI00_21180 [Nocardioides sp. S5]